MRLKCVIAIMDSFTSVFIDTMLGISILYMYEYCTVVLYIAYEYCIVSFLKVSGTQHGAD